MSGPVVVISPLTDEEARLWRLVAEVADVLRPLPWMLVGGLMVRLLEAERGIVGGFITVDVDAVLDVRTVADATRDAAARLVATGFSPEPSADGTVHRFRRGGDVVDLLAPDNIGRRVTLVTVPPGTTIEAPGTRRALASLRSVSVDDGESVFVVPVPSLLAAIVLKARVASIVSDPAARAKHERDLARLLVALPDPAAAAANLGPRERGHLRAHVALTDPAHSAWRGVAGADDGSIALALLIGA